MTEDQIKVYEWFVDRYNAQSKPCSAWVCGICLEEADGNDRYVWEKIALGLVRLKLLKEESGIHNKTMLYPAIVDEWRE